MKSCNAIASASLMRQDGDRVLWGEVGNNNASATGLIGATRQVAHWRMWSPRNNASAPASSGATGTACRTRMPSPRHNASVRASNSRPLHPTVKVRLEVPINASVRASNSRPETGLQCRFRRRSPSMAARGLQLSRHSGDPLLDDHIGGQQRQREASNSRDSVRRWAASRLPESNNGRARPSLLATTSWRGRLSPPSTSRNLRQRGAFIARDVAMSTMTPMSRTIPVGVA